MIMASSSLAGARPDWLAALRRFAVFTLFGHLLWEMAHVPLYTIWAEGSAGEIAFAVVHCTGGDLLIAMSTLLLALFTVGSRSWPDEKIGTVLLAAILLGVGYTIFSEWLNIVVREAWAYRDIMPVIPVIDAGLTPVLQWIVVPTLAYAAALRRWPWAGRGEAHA
ncbi:hypothetical protein [Tranquillimonas alkanivorans]|uniref:Uncharacterized protein n=1 Tax=Tranquillimonas alkanivorans TaxID=441119 RepID=A0A1I5TMC3_9RHOB|nr:hypothetical protein [Tranquillimonas alkanivorans]SFP84222.1 hypothetical protein SAMN04488047_11430 [Tranquillimonas alkanivorans]